MSAPRLGDVRALHEILQDPAVWQHYPSLRHTSIDQTQAAVSRWIDQWEREGLGTWVVRLRGAGAVVGYGGCSVLHDAVWNLGYRFAASAQGNGYATELARVALTHAQTHRPNLPVVAYLLEHNLASSNVARKVGLSLVHRGPDQGNPDPAAVRLIYADRPLSRLQLDAASH
ncbi:GNAT family N-acetyltransferase [Amnibacterium endophyticum]|uniref:GNAT family N-acetyltransferase n=1 Tax=Amnibacterium endophyticum TaxID=2109337 RepID=A0ABW4LFD8_9MICO